jgi:hypothetical protein
MTVVSRVPAGARTNDDLRTTLARWQTLVLALDDVDVMTTEVVRLRAAKHHDCHT